MNKAMASEAIVIREATAADFSAIWSIFSEIVGAGDTYAFPVDCDQAEARRLWLALPEVTYVAEVQGRVLGTYYLKPNAMGPGDHVCNCGYMVASAARGMGVASAMCTHSLKAARERGYAAMQFNSVVATNRGAIRLWQRMGFEIVGRLPKAFRHPAQGYVDSLVMYRWLAE